ncbi:MAG: Ig domain-containing protein [Pedobacter sp.]|nr:MAG: Ig domain-containing protein [Pedobacter sp.]
MKKLILSLAIVVTVLFAGCKKNPSVPEPAKQPFKFNFETLVLNVGKGKDITLADVTTDFSFSDIRFESSNDNIATIVSKVAVMAVAQGTVEIKAFKGNTEVGKFKLTVNYIPVAAMTMPDVTIRETEVTSLVVKFTPDDASNQKFTWSSADPTIASVTGTGYIGRATGNKAGTTTVTATSADGVKVACKVTVTALPPYPKTGVDAVVKSFMDNIMPTFEREGNLILNSIVGQEFTVRQKSVTVYNSVDQNVFIHSLQTSTSFTTYPLPTTPLGSFEYLFVVSNGSQVPAKGAFLKVGIKFSETSFEVTTSEKKTFTYTQVAEFTSYLLDAVNKDAAKAKADNKSFF